MAALRDPLPDAPTQSRRPGHAVTRTAAAAVPSAAALYAMLRDQVGEDKALIICAALLVGQALVTRILAVPAVESLLRAVAPWLAADPPARGGRHRLKLAANAGDRVHLAATARPREGIDEESRIVAGLIFPWGKAGATTMGPLVIPSHRNVRLPRELARCKLLLDHSGTPGCKPVGYAVGLAVKPDGLYMRFRVANTPDGDAALADIREGVRDALSAELNGVIRDGHDVTDCVLNAVSLVALPAYSDARVHELALSAAPPGVTTTQNGTPAMDILAFLRALLNAGQTEADARAAAVKVYGQAAADAVESAELDHQPAADADTGGDGAEAPAGLPIAGRAAPASAAASYTPRAAVVPAGVPHGRRTAELTLSQAIDTLRLVQTGQSVAHAALANITSTGLLDAIPPKWLGELWDGREVPRRIIPLMGHRDLTSWIMRGYRWTQRPMVGPYAGDKTEIPTGPVAVAPYEVEATRWAGGHDLDRKFWDFGDRSILESYWRAMNNSYAQVTDANALDWLIAQATAVGSAPDLFRAVVTAESAIADALNVSADYLIGNPADKLALLNITAQEVSAYAGLFGVSFGSIVWSSRVPAGTLIAGCKPAALHYELAGSPLRVEAEHLSHGGRDAALFGYTALSLEAPEGLVKVSITPPAGV